MRLVIRSTRLLVSSVAVLTLLAGCGSGPSQAGAAAIVGDTRIPLSKVQSWFESVLHKNPAQKRVWQKQGQLDEVGRQLASFAVQEELLEQTARAEHLSVDQRQVTDAISRMGGPQAATAGKISTAANLRDVTRAQLLATELGRKYLDRLAITFDYTQATTRHEAESKARRMSQGPEQAAAVINADRKAGLPASTGERIRAADSTELAGGTPLFGARPGTALAFETQPQSGQWIVAVIKDRSTARSSKAVAQQTDERTLEALGMRLLGLTADRVGVRLSPRYGVWDPIGLSAVPNPDQTLGFWFDGPQRSS